MSSQIGGLGGPTPRRSGRLSSKAGSVMEQSVMTTMTSGGTRKRRKGPLTQVRARKSNAYGASGRVGAAEELSVSATGFAQAFQNQRRNAVARDNEDEDSNDDDDVDELGDEPNTSGALNSNMDDRTPTADRQSLPPSSDRQPLPQAPPRFSFAETPDLPSSDDDLAFSIGNTSKSFGMEHEAGMLTHTHYHETIRSSPNFPTRFLAPVHRSSSRLPGEVTPEQAAAKAAASRATIDKSVDDLIAEERARLQREGRRPLRQQRTQRRSLKGRLEDVKRWLGQINPAEVSPFDEYDWQWLRYLKWGFWGLLTVGILALVLPFLPSILASARSGSVEMGTAIGTRISHTWHGVADWVMPGARADQQTTDEKINFDLPPGTSSEDPLVLLANARKLDEKLDRKHKIMGNAIREIQKHLPDFMVVRRHPGGNYEIPDEFWNALLSKARAYGNTPEWLEFIKTNRDKVQRLDGVPVDVTENQVRPGMISRQEFVTIMEQHYEKVSTRVDEQILDALQEQSTQIKATVQAETRKTIMDSIRLQSLAQGNLVANYELNLRKPNYFSVGNGASADPNLSSPTFLDTPKTIYAWMLRRFVKLPPPNPHMAALWSWDEPGQCWCATTEPTGKGQAQLAITLNRSMYPKQVTVEHLPLSMVPAGDISTAPREIEFWVKSDQPIRHHYHSSKDKCTEGRPGWICLGAFKYNIHSSNHVQTFDLDAEVSVPIDKTMIRVISSWGSDHTCIYRLRLHGDDAIEGYDYGVTLNG